MNTPRMLERSVASWMADEAPRVMDDDLLDSILSATGRVRPAPRWLALLQEPPMRTRSRVAVGSPTRRLALLLSLVLLLIAGTVAVATAFRPTAPTDDWPGFLGGYDHRGVAIRGPVGRPVVAWTFRADGGVSQAIAIAEDRVVVPTDNGVVHGLDRATGAERWTFRAGALGGIPVGVLVVGGNAHVVDTAGVVHALDLASGTVRWRSEAFGVLTHPTFGDGRLYFGTDAGEVIAIDAADGSTRWRRAIPGAAAAARNPAFAAGRVFSAVDGTGYTALDAATGRILWTVQTGDDVMGSARVTESLAFIGASADAVTGHLRALDAATGRAVWTVDEPLGAPAITGDRLYTGGQGVVTAREVATGAELWRATFSGYVRGVAIAGNVVYAPADGEQRIYALDAATGGELWHFDLDSGNECCVAVAGGVVFVGTDAGTVYAIGGDGAAITPAAIPDASAVVPTATPSTGSSQPADALAPNPLTVLDSTDERVTGVRTGPRTDGPEGVVMDLGPDGRVVVLDVDQEGSIIDLSTGRPVGSFGGPGQAEGQLQGIHDVAVAPDGRIVIADMGNHRLQVLDADGRFLEQLGSFGVEEGQFTSPFAVDVGPDGSIYVHDSHTGAITKLAPDGTFAWRVGGAGGPDPDLSQVLHDVAVLADGTLLVTIDEGGQALVLDTTNGSLIRRWGPADIGWSGEMAVAPDGTVWMFQYTGRLDVFSAEGERLGTVAWFGRDQDFPLLHPAPVIGPDGHAYSFAKDLGLVELEITLP